MLRLRKGSYANIASTAALVLALGGTSYAAGLITSAQIKNGTIQTRDLAPSARTAAYAAHHTSTWIDVSMDGSAPTTVLTVHVPRPGSYVLNAKAIADNSNAAGGWGDAECALFISSYVDGASARLVPEATRSTTLALQSVHRFRSAGNVELRCLGTSSSPTFTTPIHVSGAQLTAVRVASATDAAQ
jgi:hypothetical protein